MKYFNLDTDVTLGGNSASDTVVASQKAIKIYIDNNSGGTGYTATNPALTPVSGVCSWTVTHNLNSTSVICSLYSGSIEIQKNVSIDSANQITVSFNAISEVAAGSCTVVVFSKGANTSLVVDSSLSSSSENPVQNKVINTAVNNLADKNLSNLTDAGKIVSAKMSMPSNTYEDITVGVSMAELTAPSDGWVVVTGESSAQGQYLGLYKKVGETLICFSGVHSRATGDRDTVNIPLAKGDTFAISYTYDSITSAKFFYAKGSESEYVSQGE